MPGESLATTDELATALTRALDRIAALESAGQWWPGMIGWTVGTSAPAGFLIADGSVFDGDRYAALAAVLGGTTLPDLRGKTAVGKSTSGTFATMLASGGAETVTLTAGQSGLPAHTVGPDGTHTHPFEGQQANPSAAGHVTAQLSGNAADWGGIAGPVESGGSHSHTVGSANASSSHTNMPPYIVLLPIIHI